MIKEKITNTFRLENGEFLAFQENDKPVKFNQMHKTVIYFAPTLDKLGFYKISYHNLGSAKLLYLKNMKRQKKIIFGNKAFLKAEKGIYADIIYWDFKRFYPTLFNQIANHVNDDYLGKQIKGIVKKNQFIKNIKGLSKTASKAKLVDIKDIAKNAIDVDKFDKSNFTSLIDEISNQTEFYDDADKIVSKIIRNSLAYGFGYQQKHAKINNTSALVMHFANLIMTQTIRELEEKGNQVIFSHTDSFQIGHTHTKEIEDCIINASQIIDTEYFGGNGIIRLDFNSISNKDKFEDVMIINQNSYIFSKKGARGKTEVGLAISGLHTLKANAIGVSQKNEWLQELLNEHKEEIFKNDDNFFNKYGETTFMFSLIKHRLSEDYKDMLIRYWQEDNAKLYKKAIIQSNTFSAIRMLTKEAKM